jgi:hypothetical protein
MAADRSDPGTAKLICDFLVGYGVAVCVIDPIRAIFRGQIWGSEVFLAGAIVVAAAVFGELYFRDQDDAV